VYYCGALPLAYTTARYASLGIALTLWLLYFHEILIRSGRVRIGWLRQRLTDVLLMLSIALFTLLIFTIMGSFTSTLHRSH